MSAIPASPADEEEATRPALDKIPDKIEPLVETSANILFTRPGIIALAAILAAAAWFDLRPIVFLAGILLMIVVVARIWSRLSLARVFYRRELSHDRAFPGEAIDLTVILENRKILPILWLEVSEPLPAALRPDSPAFEPVEGEPIGRLKQFTSLWWYRRAVKCFRLTCRRRGYFRIGPATLTSGDLFGFVPRVKVQPEMDHLIVYPRIYTLPDLAFPSRFPLGDARAADRIFEDPAHIAGLRAYTPETPFKYIHWKASARQQTLQVKVFEPTTTLKVSLFLDVESFHLPESPMSEDEFERAVSLTASLAHRFIQDGLAVGCFANACMADTEDGQVILYPGAGLDHLTTILELLAKIQNQPSRPFGMFFDQAPGRSDLGVHGLPDRRSPDRSGIGPSGSAIRWRIQGGDLPRGRWRTLGRPLHEAARRRFSP